ncbi:MAG: sugar transferase [Saprospiraceae bacterium]|nr:sugar transferase [Saprospiraceae bacterium]
MHSNPHISEYNLATARQLLFVGFDRNFDSNINNFPYQSENYQYTVENNGFLAFLWLGQRVGELATFNLPHAVLCDLDWLINDQYRLAKQMAAHPDLCSVPLVVFTQKGKPANKSALSINGVDDCYTVPVDWSMLENRLEFLNQFKPKVLEACNRVKSENFVFMIPLRKRIFDLIGATIGILLTAWIWLPVMLAIWLESKGPVVYKSKRVGSGYQVFEFLKFRSMYLGAAEQLIDMQHLNKYQNGTSSGKPIFVKINQDPRITRVGRFIRKYSIDELPQFFNILRGEMSLVGNRPLPLYEAETLTRDEWSARFLAPAGITGLWQISKRSRPDMSAEERIGLDIAYAQSKYSVLADLIIVLKTFRVFVQKEDV